MEIEVPTKCNFEFRLNDCLYFRVPKQEQPSTWLEEEAEMHGSIHSQTAQNTIRQGIAAYARRFREDPPRLVLEHMVVDRRLMGSRTLDSFQDLMAQFNIDFLKMQADFWKNEPRHWDTDSKLPDEVRRENMEQRYYDFVDSWELAVAQTLQGTQFRFPPHDRSRSIRKEDWDGTVGKWPALERDMNTALFFPFYYPYKTLEGRPREAMKYFLQNLRVRHIEIRTELFKSLDRMKQLGDNMKHDY